MRRCLQGAEYEDCWCKYKIDPYQQSQNRRRAHVGGHFRGSSDHRSEHSFLEIITCSYSEAHLAMVLGNWLSMVLLEQGLDQRVPRAPCKLQLFCHPVIRADLVNSSNQSRKIFCFCVTSTSNCSVKKCQFYVET